MKEVFFTFLAIALPVMAAGGVIYMFLRGLYLLFADWQLSRELRELRNDAARRRLEQPSGVRRSFDPLEAFDERPPAPEPAGVVTLPLDPDWSPGAPKTAPVPSDQGSVSEDGAGQEGTPPAFSPDKAENVAEAELTTPADEPDGTAEGAKVEVLERTELGVETEAVDSDVTEENSHATLAPLESGEASPVADPPQPSGKGESGETDAEDDVAGDATASPDPLDWPNRTLD